MTVPDMTISIDHTGVTGASADLVFYAKDGEGELGITAYREPSLEPNITYSPGAGNQHGGGTPLEWAYKETILAWDFVTDASASEAESRALVAQVAAFLARLRYSITITAAGASPETWVCRPGSITPAASRSRIDLTDSNPVWQASVPAHPIRSV